MPSAPRSVRAFSLAELMVALVILGLGLLFIAAALPVGLEYTRRTVDLANADAAAEYALEQLECSLRASSNLYDLDVSEAIGYSGVSADSIRLDAIQRPRGVYGSSPTPDAAGRYQHPVVDRYEPFFKVRPFALGNIRFGSTSAGTSMDIVDDVEGIIRAYLADVLTISVPALLVDFPWEADYEFGNSAGLSLAENMQLPGIARVYPPVEAIKPFSVEAFFNNNDNDYPQYPQYNARYRTLDFSERKRECRKASDRRVSWVAFYRRIAWDEPGPDEGDDFEEMNTTPSDDTPTDDILMDSLQYELIVIVTQRPTLQHRFPRQDLWSQSGIAAFETPWACSPGSPPGDDYSPALEYGGGVDRIAPIPWLVTFKRDSGNSLPTVPDTEYDTSSDWSDRTLSSNYAEPPTLTFVCEEEVGRLLPVGSVFFPAFNDNYRQDGTGDVLTRGTGFVPHMPHSLPIYRVLEVIEDDDGSDEWSIVVENNGAYPWLSTGSTEIGWPVWVIPPAFVERDSDGQPVYERTSPILKVVRRTVTLHEIHR